LLELTRNQHPCSGNHQKLSKKNKKGGQDSMTSTKNCCSWILPYNSKAMIANAHTKTPISISPKSKSTSKALSKISTW